EVVVFVAVDIGQAGALGGGGVDREGRAPIQHPMHRHAMRPMRLRPLGELPRARMTLDEQVLLTTQNCFDVPRWNAGLPGLHLVVLPRLKWRHRDNRPGSGAARGRRNARLMLNYAV